MEWDQMEGVFIWLKSHISYNCAGFLGVRSIIIYYGSIIVKIGSIISHHGSIPLENGSIIDFLFLEFDFLRVFERKTSLLIISYVKINLKDASFEILIDISWILVANPRITYR